MLPLTSVAESSVAEQLWSVTAGGVAMGVQFWYCPSVPE